MFQFIIDAWFHHLVWYYSTFALLFIAVVLYMAYEWVANLFKGKGK